VKIDYVGPFIVGFGHRRQVGKDTLAEMVEKRLFGITDVAHMSFARQLKLSAYRLFRYAGMQDPDFYDVHPERREEPLYPVLKKAPRQIWIEMGNAMRRIAPDIWIRNVLDDHPRPSADVLLISDVRYPNEVKAIRDRGGIVVKVIRPGVPESTDVADSALANMPDKAWDRIVVNDGDKRALRSKAAAVARLIVERVGVRDDSDWE